MYLCNAIGLSNAPPKLNTRQFVMYLCNTIEVVQPQNNIGLVSGIIDVRHQVPRHKAA